MKKRKLKKHPGARDFYKQSQAIAGVSSPNCGDKVEVRLLFMVYRPLARRKTASPISSG
jgi:hypothetical protein